MGTISYDFDRPAKLLRIAIIGEVTDDYATKSIVGYWETHPEIASCDSIIDIRQDEGAISWAAVGAIAEKWHDFTQGGDGGSGRTALVVRNAQQGRLAGAIAVKFPARQFEVFMSPETALRWLRG